MRLPLGAARPSSLSTPHHLSSIRCCSSPQRVSVAKRWTEYQGINNWEGLLEPLDENLGREILRYGKFVQAAYHAFEFNPSSPSYAACRFPRATLLPRSGMPETGYKLTRNLHATSGIKLPRWIEKGPSWVSKQSSWIGYVAVCHDEEEIARLGRRDVVIAFRGTATCLEWLENLRATLTHVPSATCGMDPDYGPMVERGFLSLYTSCSDTCRSLCHQVREEVGRLLEMYGDEPLSLTVTGHSLGAALAILTAYDVTTNFRHAPLVTVISFGGPRVGNKSFGCHVERQGGKVLRIVNTNDIITKVPGFVLDEDVAKTAEYPPPPSKNLPCWLMKRLEETRWVYSDVGRELRVSSRGRHMGDVATCHDLETYLHLVNGFLSSTCPRPTEKDDFFGLLDRQATVVAQRERVTIG